MCTDSDSSQLSFQFSIKFLDGDSFSRVLLPVFSLFARTLNLSWLTTHFKQQNGHNMLHRKIIQENKILIYIFRTFRLCRPVETHVNQQKHYEWTYILRFSTISSTRLRRCLGINCYVNGGDWFFLKNPLLFHWFGLAFGKVRSARNTVQMPGSEWNRLDVF